MINKRSQEVILGMSGGVDSSVALFLLKEQGFEVIGVSLKFGFWENEKNELRKNACCPKESIERAKRICQKYGAPHFIVDASKEFRKTVIDYFLDSLREGQTPSPCSFCNRDVKIMALLRFAKEKGADYVATGHYARIEKVNQRFQILKAKDENKDQTYFLALLKQSQVSELLFPLGDYSKKEVYEIAKKEGVEIASHESQDLCFVSHKSTSDFLNQEIGDKPGKIYDNRGNFLGKHQGLHFYTIGQRRGIRLSGGPFWVVGFNKKQNILIVTNQSDDSNLFSKKVNLSDVNFISGKVPKEPLEVKTKVRYRQPLSKATLFMEDESKARLLFNEPQLAITPGQLAVFYNDNICLGGGVIN